MWDWNGFDLPDVFAVLLDCSVAAEEAGAGDSSYGHFGPLSVIAVCVVGLLLGAQI